MTPSYLLRAIAQEDLEEICIENGKLIKLINFLIKQEE